MHVRGEIERWEVDKKQRLTGSRRHKKSHHDIHPGIGPLNSPLLKIPLVLTSSAIAIAGGTPPTPPASKAMKTKYEGRQDIICSRLLIQVVVPIYKGIYWTNAIGESAAILCAHFPALKEYGVLEFISRQPAYAGNIRFTRLWLVGCVMMTAGAALRIVCYRALGRFFTWDLTLQKNQRLITSGPYSIVRHPSYVGGWLLWTGTTLTLFSPGGWLYECVSGTPLSNALMVAWGVWNVIVPIILTTRVNREDEVLKKEFGEEWKAWARRTPYKLIPFLY